MFDKCMISNILIGLKFEYIRLNMCILKISNKIDLIIFYRIDFDIFFKYKSTSQKLIAR